MQNKPIVNCRILFQQYKGVTQLKFHSSTKAGNKKNTIGLCVYYSYSRICVISAINFFICSKHKNMIVRFFYNLFVVFYPLVARIISVKNVKARLWIQGRKNIFRRLKDAFEHNQHKVIWVHCSSLGEFEQGRPVMEKLKQQYPQYKILLTFFSPSGYEVRKDYKGADWIFYLPMDSPIVAKRFFDIVNPSLVLFIKYEFWFYYLNEAKKRNIPLLLISGIFREGQPFFKWYGLFHRRMLQCFTHLFVQNEDVVLLLKSIGFDSKATVSGDTRFDRVVEIADNFLSISEVEKFIADNKVIVAGSTWTEDDEELDHYANTHPEIKFIIAPHDIDEERLKDCSSLYKRSILYSEWKEQSGVGLTSKQYNVLIIDNIGMLSRLYAYATVCYVGGGFGDDGVHNVLEAAVYKKPVVFGPVYEKYLEAVGLIDEEGGFSIESALELEKILDELLLQGEDYDKYAANAGNYVKQHAGAVDKVMRYIEEKRLLTN